MGQPEREHWLIKQVEKGNGKLMAGRSLCSSRLSVKKRHGLNKWIR